MTKVAEKLFPKLEIGLISLRVVENEGRKGFRTPRGLGDLRDSTTFVAGTGETLYSQIDVGNFYSIRSSGVETMYTDTTCFLYNDVELRGTAVFTAPTAVKYPAQITRRCYGIRGFRNIPEYQGPVQCAVLEAEWFNDGDQLVIIRTTVPEIRLEGGTRIEIR